jgi:hypothetical protein
MAHDWLTQARGCFERGLRECAARRGTTLRELVLDAVRRELSHEEFLLRLRHRPRTRLGRPAAELLEEARTERERRR